jgi:hypothetical protein
MKDKNYDILQNSRLIQAQIDTGYPNKKTLDIDIEIWYYFLKFFGELLSGTSDGNL